MSPLSHSQLKPATTPQNKTSMTDTEWMFAQTSEAPIEAYSADQNPQGQITGTPFTEHIYRRATTSLATFKAKVASHTDPISNTLFTTPGSRWTQITHSISPGPASQSNRRCELCAGRHGRMTAPPPAEFFSSKRTLALLRDNEWKHGATAIGCPQKHCFGYQCLAHLLKKPAFCDEKLPVAPFCCPVCGLDVRSPRVFTAEEKAAMVLFDEAFSSEEEKREEFSLEFLRIGEKLDGGDEEEDEERLVSFVAMVRVALEYPCISRTSEAEDFQKRFLEEIRGFVNDDAFGRFENNWKERKTWRPQDGAWERIGLMLPAFLDAMGSEA